MDYQRARKLTLSSFAEQDAALKAELRSAGHGIQFDDFRNTDEYWRIVNKMGALRRQAVEDGLFADIHEASVWSEQQSKGTDAAKREAMEQFRRQQSKTDDSIDFY